MSASKCALLLVIGIAHLCHGTTTTYSSAYHNGKRLRGAKVEYSPSDYPTSQSAVFSPSQLATGPASLHNHVPSTHSHSTGHDHHDSRTVVRKSRRSNLAQSQSQSDDSGSFDLDLGSEDSDDIPNLQAPAVVQTTRIATPAQPNAVPPVVTQAAIVEEPAATSQTTAAPAVAKAFVPPPNSGSSSAAAANSNIAVSTGSHSSQSGSGSGWSSQSDWSQGSHYQETEVVTHPTTVTVSYSHTTVESETTPLPPPWDFHSYDVPVVAGDSWYSQQGSGWNQGGSGWNQGGSGWNQGQGYYTDAYGNQYGPNGQVWNGGNGQSGPNGQANPGAGGASQGQTTVTTTTTTTNNQYNSGRPEDPYEDFSHARQDYAHGHHRTDSSQHGQRGGDAGRHDGLVDDWLMLAGAYGGGYYGAGWEYWGTGQAGAQGHTHGGRDHNIDGIYHDGYHHGYQSHGGRGHNHHSYGSSGHNHYGYGSTGLNHHGYGGLGHAGHYGNHFSYGGSGHPQSMPGYGSGYGFHTQHHGFGGPGLHDAGHPAPNGDWHSPFPHVDYHGPPIPGMPFDPHTWAYGDYHEGGYGNIERLPNWGYALSGGYSHGAGGYEAYGGWGTNRPYGDQHNPFPHNDVTGCHSYGPAYPLAPGVDPTMTACGGGYREAVLAVLDLPEVDVGPVWEHGIFARAPFY